MTVKKIFVLTLPLHYDRCPNCESKIDVSIGQIAESHQLRFLEYESINSKSGKINRFKNIPEKRSQDCNSLIGI